MAGLVDPNIDRPTDDVVDVLIIGPEPPAPSQLRLRGVALATGIDPIGLMTPTPDLVRGWLAT